MSDDSTPTWVYTEEGDLPFQEYFVHQGCRPRVLGFRFENIQEARPAPGVLESLRMADLLIICPSNPWVSIDPILSVPGIRSVLETRRATGAMAILAVSPIIGGKTVKGPAAKMYAELGIKPSALAVARHYGSLLTGFVLDTMDAHQAETILSLGIQPLVTETLMKGPEDRRRLAMETLEFAPHLGARCVST
jgi:LPPG:FO 2-phospho-L-lactate transferase